MKKQNFILYSILTAGFICITTGIEAKIPSKKMSSQLIPKGETSPVVDDRYIQNSANVNFLEALSSAYQTSPVMQGSNADQRIAAEGVAQARTGYHPSIKGKLTNNRSLAENNSITPKGGGVTTAQPGNNTFSTYQSAGIILEQNLFKGGETMFGVRAAEEGLRGSWEGFKNTEQSVLLAAAVAYLDLILKRRTLEQRASSEKFLKDNYQYIKALQEAGENKTISDVAEAESKYYSAISARVKAEGELDVAIATYINVIGKKPEANLENPTIPLEVIPKNIEELQSLALESNPEIKNLQYAVKQAQENVKVARTAWAPSLDVNVGASRDLTYTQDDRRNTNNSTADKRATNYEIKTSLTVPFYQKGGEYTGLRNKKETESKARISLENKRQEVIQNCRKYWDQLVSSKNQIASLRVAIKSARINMDGKRKMYEAGDGILLEVNQAEEQLTTAVINLGQSEKDYREAVFQLMKLIRRLDVDTLRLGVQKYTYENYYKSVKEGIF